MTSKASSDGTSVKRTASKEKLPEAKAQKTAEEKKKVAPIPPGYHTITPYISVPDAEKIMEFMKKAFNAVENYRMAGPGGKIAHAELTIGDSKLMIGTVRDGQPVALAHIYLYVEDVDKVYRQALDAGGISVSEPTNMFYGDRHGAVKDSAGNSWYIATHIEDVSHEDMKTRAEAAMPKK